MRTYPIVETFYSIQGEGKYAGRAAFFIRFFKCNLKCDFGYGFVCDDTAHTNKELLEKMTSEQLCSLAKDTGTRLIVLTGGEVSLQDVNPLIEDLRAATGAEIAIETNGTNIENISAADYIAYAPKDAFDVKAPKLQARFHELRILAGVHNPVDTERWATVKNKYISPINYEHKLNMENVNYCIEFVKANPSWKLSLQTHKTMGVR